MDATSHPDAGPRLPETSAPGGDAALHEEALAVLADDGDLSALPSCGDAQD